MFHKAQKHKAKARIAITGPSGSGKTMSALHIATGLGKRIAVLDTENDSASLYADKFDFDVCKQVSHSPANYVTTIKAAEAAGYDVLVIDSLSHAWNGKDGALEMVDKAAARAQGNSYAGWRGVTPEHNKLIDAIVGSTIHIIATMRSKTEYILESGKNGKQAPKKVGLAPIQRDGMEYEFTIFGEMDLDHNIVITKSRCSAFQDAVIEKPTAQLGRDLIAWLNDGADVTALPDDPKYLAGVAWGEKNRPLLESYGRASDWDAAVKAKNVKELGEISGTINKTEKAKTATPQAQPNLSPVSDDDIPM